MPTTDVQALTMNADGEVARINLTWLLKLRWGMAIGQLVVILGVDRGLNIELDLPPLFLLVALVLVSNLAAMLWLRDNQPVSNPILGSLMTLDVLQLTGVLFYSGGPHNPFSFLYLVHISLAVVVLSPGWTWLLLGLSCLGSALLFIEHVWLSPTWMDVSDPHLQQMKMHLYGMWLAFGVSAVFIVYFVSRVRSSLQTRDAELSAARAVALRSEKLSSLATLAAGAAHELSTPLSTIALVASELQRALELQVPGSEAVDDARLIRQEVERCRHILSQMAADAGHSAGEVNQRVTIGQLLDTIMQLKTFDHDVTIDADAQALGATIEIPFRAIMQSLRGVLKNAAQASVGRPAIEIKVRLLSQRAEITVIDHGSGMEQTILQRAGEPFFTTKEPGHGMGLGLFLARAEFERAGGGFELTSQAGTGTTARLWLPLAPATIGHIAQSD